MRATEIGIDVTLIVEWPSGAKPLDTIDLSKWLLGQLDKFITLPFDRDTRSLLHAIVVPRDDGKEIDYQ